MQRWRGGWLEVTILARLVQGLRDHTHTHEGQRKFNLEQLLNGSAASTASPGEHLTFHPNISTLSPKSI